MAPACLDKTPWKKKKNKLGRLLRDFAGSSGMLVLMGHGWASVKATHTGDIFTHALVPSQDIPGGAKEAESACRYRKGCPGKARK